MKKELKRFVTFLAPGAFVGESWTQDIESADPMEVTWPTNAYAFTMHEREDVVDGETRYSGKAVQIGPMYYHPDSKIETLEEVKRNPRRGSSLVGNMECNEWDRVIWTRWGNWPQPFRGGEVEVLRHNVQVQRDSGSTIAGGSAGTTG